MPKKEIEIIRFKNSLKAVIEKKTNTENVHIGLIINVGSRNENKSIYGIAHLIEHLIFKGTNKHQARYILNRIDSIGGELNAYTTKEKTVIHASVNKKYFERALDLIAEIFQFASFPEAQILKEKEVVKDEIQSYNDNPYEQIYDDFEELLFSGHSLAHPILGNVKSLDKINRKQIVSFYKKHYNTYNAVVSILGPVNTEYTKEIIEQKFSADNFICKKVSSSQKKLAYQPFQKEIFKDTHQSHCIMGNHAYDIKSNHRLPFILLTNILGGPAMNNRLNMNIREKYGYTYAIEAQYSAYCDAGIFTVYFGVDKKYLQKTISLVKKELQYFKKNTLSKTMLTQAKDQLCGQISLANDNYVSTMLANGKSLMYFDKVITYQELFSKINSITPNQIYECAQTVFNEKKISTLIYN
ncbi:MAG: insulinase family protein [Flavobacteriales bacterium]|nr:insulinase family protein [Flavobacteriales bacterium]